MPNSSHRRSRAASARHPRTEAASATSTRCFAPPAAPPPALLPSGDRQRRPFRSEQQHLRPLTHPASRRHGVDQHRGLVRCRPALVLQRRHHHHSRALKPLQLLAQPFIALGRVPIMSCIHQCWHPLWSQRHPSEITSWSYSTDPVRVCTLRPSVFSPGTSPSTTSIPRRASRRRSRVIRYDRR